MVVVKKERKREREAKLVDNGNFREPVTIHPEISMAHTKCSTKKLDSVG